MKKKHIGSKLDDLLQADRLLETTTATATKRVIAHQIAQEMKRRRLTKVAMATRMRTSRAALDRLRPMRPWRFRAPGGWCAECPARQKRSP